jgi:curved DNA-binding protein CbpA
MSFHIERGLFKYDFTDHHAILGIPIDADSEAIRQRYKQVARLLHPDSCKAENPAEKEQASQMFSKLVSPAYALLSKERSRKEHSVLLRTLRQRLLGESGKVPLKSDSAKQLAQASGDIDLVYKTAVQNLASKQYESINQIIEMIAQLSELNMVYLIRKEPRKVAGTSSQGDAGKSGNGKVDEAKKGEEQKKDSQVDPYLRRAEEYINKGNSAKAVLELRDAMALDPNNSRCHGLLGLAYLKQNQATMAKVHINKALQLNPQEPSALKGREVLDKLAKPAAAGSKTPAQGNSTAGKPPQGKPDGKSGGGGLFGGLFGGKKK